MRRTLWLCLVAAMAVWGTPVADAQQGVASLVVDLTSGATLSSEQRAIIDRAVLPGSVMKIVAVAAALEAEVITPRASIVCTRTVVVNGHRLTCTHPDLHRPLTAEEALTHSCNVYVATVAARLPRASLDRVLASLNLPVSGTAPVQAVALGLEGPHVVPAALVNVVARIAGGGPAVPWRPATIDVLRRGLRGAATAGTAAALGAAGIDALAKTGTVDAGGVSQGLVVGVSPSQHPTRGFALLVSGGAGMDAAALVAERLRARVTTENPSSPAHALGRDVRTPGRVRVGVMQRDQHYAVREMSVDDYVAQVIAGEQATASGDAALDALAIAARTYALANIGRHASEGFDLCDLTHCQVMRKATAGSRAASLRTAGQYLAAGNHPASVFYTASCGGHTERPSAVWRGAEDVPYLPSHADPACAGEPTWQSYVPAGELLRALHAGGFRGDAVRSLAIAARTASGRVQWVRVDGVAPAEITGENLRTLVGRVLGWQVLRSTLFEVTRTSTGFHFEGRGAGHGVGLCVVGAANRARRGESVAQILAAYYPGLELRTTSGDRTAMSTGVMSHGPALRVQLPREHEPMRALVQEQAVAALAAVTSRLQPDAIPPLTLRFHPTVESYERASGSPWFTTATTHGRTVDLLPLDVLRRRGLLGSTLRHELAHAATADALSRAPRWVHEGVAEWASRGDAARGRPPAPDASSAPACPADIEFMRASSAQQLSRLYDRALVCYLGDLRAGRSWKTWQQAIAAPSPAR